MFDFNFGKKTFIGMDIGTSSVKIIELALEEDTPVLSNYVWMSIGDIPGKDDMNSNYFDLVLPEYIKKMLKEAKIKGKDIYMSLPAFGGLITVLDFPEMSKEDLEQAVRFEAHKYIPTSLEEVVLSWDIVGRKPGVAGGINNIKLEGPAGESEKIVSSDRLEVLLVAAARNKVVKYEGLIKNLGLNLRSLEIESFPMVTSLIGNDPGNFLIVDMGSRVCNMILVEKGIIKVTRNIDAGGKDFTKTISKGMGIDDDRAEKLKISGKNFFQKDSYLNFPTLELIVGEASRIINSYSQKEKSFKIDGIVLSGGTAQLTGLIQYFQDNLKVKTIIGNPFARIQYDKRLEPIMAQMRTQFSVSSGLALRGVEQYLIQKNSKK